MKGKLIAFAGILCIASLIVSAANARGKPDKPPKTETELIIFTGNLSGNEPVEGCCPNAGPFPEYGMWLSGVGNIQDGYYDGFLFINHYGAGREHKYKVQFWTEEFGIEIIGGEVDNDKKNKTLTVTFAKEDCVDLYTKTFIEKVDFQLVRTPY
jgi:hypothetical protein